MLLPKRSRRFGFRSRPHAVAGWLAVGLVSAGGSLANAPVEGATGGSADTSGRWTDGLSDRGIRREPFVAAEALPPTSSPLRAPHAPLSRLDEEIGTPGALEGGVLLRGHEHGGGSGDVESYAGYDASYLFGLTRSVARSTIAVPGKLPLFVLTIPLDLALLPFAAIGGFFS